ncbi:MAG: hypothetical protein GPOALKHO_001213 [Sodalis sp.]|nr:MAG: hypothetical protein GPOALKHO_001213 [Sodalis sp.]
MTAENITAKFKKKIDEMIGRQRTNEGLKSQRAGWMKSLEAM